MLSPRKSQAKRASARCAAGLTLALLLPACGPSEIVAAGVGGTSGVDGILDGRENDQGEVLTPFIQPSATVKGIEPGSDWIGRWTGTLAPSEGPTVNLALSLSYSEGALDGVATMVFGDSAPPVGPSDPTLGYPLADAAGHVPGLHHGEVPASGFRYVVLDGEAGPDRLSLVISLNQLWTGWCDLQPNRYFDRSEGRYLCVPLPAERTAEGECVAGPDREPVDCDRMDLCTARVCVCFPDRCSADLFSVESFTLDRAGPDEVFGTSSLGEITLRRSAVASP